MDPGSLAVITNSCNRLIDGHAELLTVWEIVAGIEIGNQGERKSYHAEKFLLRN